MCKRCGSAPGRSRPAKRLADLSEGINNEGSLLLLNKENIKTVGEVHIRLHLRGASVCAPRASGDREGCASSLPGAFSGHWIGRTTRQAGQRPADVPPSLAVPTSKQAISLSKPLVGPGRPAVAIGLPPATADNGLLTGSCKIADGRNFIKACLQKRWPSWLIPPLIVRPLAARGNLVSPR